MKTTIRFALLTLIGTLGTWAGGSAESRAADVPTVTLSASPLSLQPGWASTLKWSSTNASSCVASGGWSGNRSTSGTESTGGMDTNATFTLTCTGSGGSAQASVTVTVQGSGPPAPTVSLSASPSRIDSGGSSTLTWSTTNATSCTASGGWSGAKGTSGSTSTGALTASTTFTLACTGTGGTAQRSATVTVRSSTTPAPTVSLNASPTQVASGGSSTLTWSSTNATSCTASNGWSGTKATSGTASTGALTTPKTYTLSCTGTGGTAQASATVSVSAPTPAPVVTLTASPTSVSSGGTSTLTWSTSNATSCTASGGWTGARDTAGSESTAALSNATTFTLACSGAGGTAQTSVTVTLIGATSTWPLHVEPGKRYLLDAQNRPFLIQGDSPWSLISRLTRENVDLYLETRRQQGFNAVMTNLIEHQFTDNPPKNAYGVAPFTRAGDFSTPNEAYFAHAEYVIAKAQEKGMLVLLVPAYLGYQGGSEGWYSEMRSNGTVKLRAYGQWVANRFRNYDNIIWVEGGDYNPPDKTLTRAVANGIRDVDTVGKWPQTFHGGRGTGALEFLSLSSDPWLTVNNIYTDATTVVSEAYGQYAASTMPFFLIEAGYENNDVDGAGVRMQAYQAVFSGAMGQMMGNFPVWYFGSGWQNALNSTGASTLKHLPGLFTSTNIPWWNLVPDTNRTVLTSSPGSGTSRVAAARVSDGSAVVVFTPSSRTLTIDMSKLAGPNVSARWYNPATGAFTAISGAPFANSGSRSFSAPSGRDSVLVLQSQP